MLCLPQFVFTGRFLLLVIAPVHREILDFQLLLSCISLLFFYGFCCSLVIYNNDIKNDTSDSTAPWRIKLGGLYWDVFCSLRLYCIVLYCFVLFCIVLHV